MITRTLENDRLAYYSTETNPIFWDAHWKKYFSPDMYKKAERGSFVWFEKPFTTYLSREGRILEAGCGLGMYVLALRVRGYDAEGVESGAETVKMVRERYPDLPIRVGDVTCMEVPEKYYSGYISLGVMEHSINGPELFIEEAYRVLRDDGVAIISVPSFHPLRRLKARLGLYRGQCKGLEFYQYAFTKREFIAILQKHGFRVVDEMIYDGFKGLKDEIRLLEKIVQWPVIGRRLRNWVQSCQWIEHRLGHMMLFVCRKAQETNE
jgi:SAM-dependent methyltransferase